MKEITAYVIGSGEARHRESTVKVPMRLLGFVQQGRGEATVGKKYLLTRIFRTGQAFHVHIYAAKCLIFSLGQFWKTVASRKTESLRLETSLHSV